ncbi:hypothetical protein [Streptomyces curacoi]|uniref:Uncharacterized protein n=1 Tax=Streptomyces curacoi TaxID=146536 RepID=A0A124H5Q6_9ACTN|nr:hypothetical protein [Streptomyces curacoi]KUM79593.1 hypothetical protein AQI70_09560 [Streptomyces curacoi]
MSDRCPAISDLSPLASTRLTDLHLSWAGSVLDWIDDAPRMPGVEVLRAEWYTDVFPDAEIVVG